MKIRHRKTAGVTPAKRRLARGLIYTLVAATGISPLGGCGLLSKIPPGPKDTRKSYHDNYGLNIEYPDVKECASPVAAAAESSLEPNTLQDPSQMPVFELSLEEAVRMAVENSPVIRQNEGTVGSVAVATTTVYGPSIAAAGQQGTEAALSAFDAQYTNQLFWQKIDQPRNSLPFNAGVFVVAGLTNQNLATFSNELSKTTALGSQFALRHVVNYSRVNDLSVFARLFPSDFSGHFEAEWRQPLLQGAGTTFNRIAGPTNVVGQYNGVLIARVNEDLSLTDFEKSVVKLVSDVEQRYWELTTAYRVLDASVKGRDAAQQTFQYQQVRLEVGSGRRDEEAQARSQFYQFQAQVQSALAGANGLYEAEQNLRYLIGLPAADGRLIRPTTEPTDVKVVFDWQSALSQALQRNVDLRATRYVLKQRELELTAARLNVRPRLDLLAQYRWRGLGDHLIGSGNAPVLENLYGNIANGNFQEWQAGVEFTLPVGMRRATVELRRAKLAVSQQRAWLAENELITSHNLADSTRNVELTFQLMETNYNRYIADLNQVDVLRRRYLDGSDNINFLLQAQRQVVTSETEFYRSITNYNLAIRDLHRQKGSLLAYNNIQMGEGPWAAGANRDAYEQGRFMHPRYQPEKVHVDRPITRGPFDPTVPQHTQGAFAGDAVGVLSTEIPADMPPAPQPIDDEQFDDDLDDEMDDLDDLDDSMDEDLDDALDAAEDELDDLEV